MNIERIPAGPLETNCYVVSEGRDAVVIDPSLNCTPVISYIEKNDLHIEAILLTHGHFDHFLGIYELWEAFGNTPLWLHENERGLIADPDMNLSSWAMIREKFDGESTPYQLHGNQVGPFTFSAFPTPGHTPGGVSLLFGSDCFTGDTLFAGGVGRTDFPYGDFEQLANSIKTQLFTLPDETVVWPGHGFKSSIGYEKAHNPYIR